MWNKTRRASRFIFKTMPLGILGIKSLRQNNETIKNLYASIRNPKCPMCPSGVLSPQLGDVIEESRADDNHIGKYVWTCNRCEYAIHGSNNKNSILPSVLAIDQGQALSKFNAMADKDRQAIVKTHTLHSRIFYAASLIIFLCFCWRLAHGVRFSYSISWLSMALCLFIFGMKKSYRAWQMENRVLFVKNAFKMWFNHEKWFR